jgi:protein-S-isoprenylcysteine O-methyltransferase Ste14
MVTIRRVASEKARHHWTDWAGILFFLGMAVTVLRSTPMVGIMMLPIVLCDVVVGISFLIRRPAKARLEGWAPRIATYSGAFLIQTFLAFASSRHPSWLAPTPVAWAFKVGISLWLVGLILNSCAIWHLRHSFSISPQARELVRTGPYRLTRHPIYATHVLMCIGVLLAHFTLPVVLAVLIWAGLMSARVHYEEMVLEGAFPEYAEYRQQVGLFGPRFFSGVTAREKPAQLPPTA